MPPLNDARERALQPMQFPHHFQHTIDEEVIARTPPLAKTWQTIGKPHMLVLDAYRMGYSLEPRGSALGSPCSSTTPSLCEAWLVGLGG